MKRIALTSLIILSLFFVWPALAEGLTFTQNESGPLMMAMLSLAALWAAARVAPFTR